ncbi:hypothetical protein [Marinobacterium stanieri]|uniref:Bacteriophage lambda head decoration protein D n=1 Tax=Marinobacterium stanieri TaxID=49186 RepID=A0A1N6RPT1_9GAMM|nr:hypothetical protein [Marinobacterium stanieri]SIQ30805.1 hypothetical protein SAMN05421647_103454 [Marinobacterium stanieri]
MTALTKERNTPTRLSKRFSDPVAASAVIFAGALVVLDASGNAAKGTTATGLTARGVAQATVDNSNGAAADKTVETEAGTHRFVNDGTDTIDRTDIGGTAYIVDDQTVAATDGTGTRSAAGKIVDVDDLGVWVEIG